MNSYEQRQAERKARLERAAEAASAEATRRFEAARESVAGIPFGQPILVGHHSEGRHRAALRRHDRNMDKGCEAYKASQELASRAASVGTGGISSDDPDATAKLRAELAELEAKQARDKAINAAFRKRDADALAALGLDLAVLQAKFDTLPAYAQREGIVPGYSLSNRSANIRRIKGRIADLEKRDAACARVAAVLEAERAAGGDNAGCDRCGSFDRTGGDKLCDGCRGGPAEVDPKTAALVALAKGVTYAGTLDGIEGAATVRLDTDDNRVWVTFPKGWATLRAGLKSGGFRWSPQRVAWVRMATPGVDRHATIIVRRALGLPLDTLI